MSAAIITMGPALLVAGCACLFYVALIFYVARMRAICGVPAPAMVGHPDFERVLRAQLNMHEQLTPFLACLMAFAVTMQPIAAAVLGGIWLFGRVVFTLGYLKNSPVRVQGFAISMLSLVVLAGGAIIGAIRLIWGGAQGQLL